MHTKTRKFRTARRICVARVLGWILTTRPSLTAKWYKMGQPCFEDKIQELNTDFSTICISTSDTYGQGSPRFPYQFLRNWNIKLGRTSQPLTSRLPLLKLLLPATLLWRIANTVLNLPSKKVKS